MSSQPRAMVPKGTPGLLQRALSFFGRKENYPYASASTSFSTLDGDVLAKIFGRSTHTGRVVTDDFAMAVSAWFRCIQLKAQTVGALPWAVYERVAPNKSVEVPDHPLAEVLIHSPNADMDRMQFREAIEANLANRQNAYALKETRRDGSLISLYPIPSSNCTPRRNRESRAIEYVVNEDGRQQEVYPSEKIWHVRGFSFNGLVGLDTRTHARHALALAGAAEEFGSRFFANGARISGIVKIPQWLEADERVKAKKNLDEFWSGLDNAHKLKLLEGGMEYEQVSVPPDEAQHNELRNFQIRDICRFQGVPPHLAFDLEHGSYANVETLAGEWVTFGLMPDLVRIELAAQKQLLTPADRKRFFVRFNFEGLLRANSLERAQFYQAMLQNGVFSRNEVREKENLSPVEEAGMDDRTVQTNLALIQFIEAMAKAGAATGRGNDPGAPKQ
jgi:HK97 family phage portal protein